MNLDSLFTNEEYSSSHIDVGRGHSVSLLCLESACTDHDLTGQVVWPVSVLLATFVASQDWKGKKCVEVGAGCGLAGFAAAQAANAESVVVTDGSEIVLNLLRRTVDECGKDRVAVARLTWGDRRSAEDYVSRHGPPDIVLGADVVAWPQSIDPLLQTLKYLFLSSSSSSVAFYCGFVCRATKTRDLFYARAREFGFRVESVDQSTFLPPEIPELVAHSHQRLELLRVELDENSTQEPVVFLSDDPERYEATQTAC